MNKKLKLALNNSLDKALEPPKPKKKNLDSLLEQYNESNPYQTHTSTQPNPHQTQPETKPSAPVKDFNKRANSIERDALPAGLFPGASKAIYDALYIRTIGAVISKRQIQATRKEIMHWSGIKNVKTINHNLQKLQTSGLVKILSMVGEQNGSIYEVNLPEDASPAQTDTRPRPEATQPQPPPFPNLKTDLDQYQKAVWVGLGNPIENKDTSDVSKTSFKTKEEKTDDEPAAAFADFNKIFDLLFEELTGKGVELKSKQKLKNLAEVLAQEIRVAADRTEAVSDVAAFAAKHFSNRFFSARRKEEQNDKVPAYKSDAGTTKKIANKRPPYVELCPDCFGSGFYNPDGKGMRPNCPHEKLAVKVSEMKEAGELSD